MIKDLYLPIISCLRVGKVTLQIFFFSCNIYEWIILEPQKDEYRALLNHCGKNYFSKGLWNTKMTYKGREVQILYVLRANKERWPNL